MELTAEQAKILHDLANIQRHLTASLAQVELVGSGYTDEEIKATLKAADAEISSASITSTGMRVLAGAASVVSTLAKAAL